MKIIGILLTGFGFLSFFICFVLWSIEDYSRIAEPIWPIFSGAVFMVMGLLCIFRKNRKIQPYR